MVLSGIHSLEECRWIYWIYFAQIWDPDYTFPTLHTTLLVRHLKEFQQASHELAALLSLKHLSVSFPIIQKQLVLET